MTQASSGSQSKTVVLASSIFMVAMVASSVWVLVSGPDPESVFFFFRTGLILYPMAILGIILFSIIAIIGFRKMKKLPNW